MAEPVAVGELGSWRGEGVRLGAVLDALADLRRAEQRTATRACVTNLVVVADAGEATGACDTIRRLGRRHPGRSIVVVPAPDASPAGIDADVRLHGTTAGGHAVWSEHVRLDVRGEPARHLHSLVEPLTLPDVPVAVWWTSGVPHPDDGLVGQADLVVVDAETRDRGATAALALAQVARRRAVADLCWLRLRPWRQLLAGLFEVPAHRPFLAGVRAVEAAGPPTPRVLLASWLVSRLGLAPEAVTVTPADAIAVRATAEHRGGIATFTVTGPSGGGPGRVEATVAGPVPARRPDRLSLPDDPPAWALGQALLETGRDRVHAQALQAAATLPAADDA